MENRIINTNLYGKEEMFKIIALGEATRLPVLLVGPPGVAKTAVLMDYAASMYGENKEIIKKKTFVIELDEATKNSEIKGRPDMKSLLEDKKYVVDAPIADAEYVLINEVDKGSSGVRNTLLSVMREKALFLGHEIRDCKWKLFAGSCNEITKDSSDAPFWDRFLIKYKVERVQIDTMFSSWDGQNIEFSINVPDFNDISACRINMNKMRQFVSYIHNDISDRTAYQIPMIVKAVKLIWDCSDTEAIMKTCDLIVPSKTATLGAQIEDKRVTAVKTKIAQIKSIKDTDQMAILIHDIEREFNKLKNEDMGDDIIELKQIMKKEVTQSKVCQALLQRGSQKSKTVNNESSQAPYQTSIPVEPSTVIPKNDTEVDLPF